MGEIFGANMTIRLFTTVYFERDPVRRAEYETCLKRNLACPAIDTVYVLVEGRVDWLPASPKLHLRGTERRPLYADFFGWMGEVSGPDDVCILANTDIWFGAQLQVLRRMRLQEREVWALSRWDARPGEPVSHYYRADSQDVWILRGGPHGVFGDFPPGMPRCDNRIAAEFVRAGYRVRNPSFSVQAFHLHEAPPRPYEEEEHSRLIPPPYLYVWPENLWSWPRIAHYNWRYQGERLAYRFDARRWSLLRPLRRARYYLGALRRRLLSSFQPSAA